MNIAVVGMTSERRQALALTAAFSVALALSFWVEHPAWVDFLTTFGLLFAFLDATFRGAIINASLKRLAWPALALVWAVMFSAQASVDFYRSTRAFVVMVNYGLVFCLVLAHLDGRLIARQTLWRSLVAASGLVFMIVAGQWIVDGAPLIGYRITYETNNAMGLFVMLGLAHWATTQGRPYSLYLMAALAFTTWFSASRGGLAALMAGLGALGGLWRVRVIELAKKYWPVSLAASGGLLALIVNLDLPHRAGRWHLWQVAVEMFQRSPLIGTGPDTYKLFWMAAPRADPNQYGHAHNVFVNALGEIGIIGLCALLWLLIVLARELWKRRDTPWGRAAICANVALLVQSMGDTPTTQPYVTFAWLMLTALALTEADDDVDRTLHRMDQLHGEA